MVKLLYCQVTCKKITLGKGEKNRRRRSYLKRENSGIDWISDRKLTILE